MQLFLTTGKVASNLLEEFGDMIFSKKKFWTYLSQSNIKDYADRSDCAGMRSWWQHPQAGTLDRQVE
jgi:hypothetical protein